MKVTHHHKHLTKKGTMQVKAKICSPQNSWYLLYKPLMCHMCDFFLFRIVLNETKFQNKGLDRPCITVKEVKDCKT